MGIATILAARRCVLLATGAAKAEVDRARAPAAAVAGAARVGAAAARGCDVHPRRGGRVSAGLRRRCGAPAAARRCATMGPAASASITSCRCTRCPIVTDVPAPAGRRCLRGPARGHRAEADHDGVRADRPLPGQRARLHGPAGAARAHVPGAAAAGVAALLAARARRRRHRRGCARRRCAGRNEALRRWAASVWDAWRDHHDQVAALVRRSLRSGMTRARSPAMADRARRPHRLTSLCPPARRGRPACRRPAQRARVPVPRRQLPSCGSRSSRSLRGCWAPIPSPRAVRPSSASPACP